MNVDEAMLVAAKQGGLPETDEWHDEVIDALDVLSSEIERLRAELAAAKAASVCPVNASWCYESNECDIVITGMSDEDSTKFGNWLRERMKERGEG